MNTIPTKMYLGQVCVKCTAKGISDVYEIKAAHDYEACDKLQEISGIKIDGRNNYVNLVLQ